MLDNYYYNLVNGKPIPVSFKEWIFQDKKESWRVGLTDCGNNVTVSTVFLGLNHNWGDGEPLLYETMVFGGKLHNEMERYSTVEQAREGHERMVQRVKDSEI